MRLPDVKLTPQTNLVSLLRVFITFVKEGGVYIIPFARFKSQFKPCSSVVKEVGVYIITFARFESHFNSCTWVVSDAGEKEVVLPKQLEAVTKATSFPLERHRWNTNEVRTGQIVLRVNHTVRAP